VALAVVVAALVVAGEPVLARGGKPEARAQRKTDELRVVASAPFSASALTARAGKASVLDGPGKHLLPQRERLTDRWLARDKAAHFAASAFLSAFGYYVARREREWRNRPSQQFGLVFGFAFGIAKEVRDARCPRGTASWKDLAADLLGCVVGTALVAVPDGVVFGGEP